MTNLIANSHFNIGDVKKVANSEKETKNMLQKGVENVDDPENKIMKLINITNKKAVVNIVLVLGLIQNVNTDLKVV